MGTVTWLVLGPCSADGVAEVPDYSSGVTLFKQAVDVCK
jgi:hypothetical protein